MLCLQFNPKIQHQGMMYQTEINSKHILVAWTRLEPGIVLHHAHSLSEFPSTNFYIWPSTGDAIFDELRNCQWWVQLVFADVYHVS